MQKKLLLLLLLLLCFFITYHVFFTTKTYVIDSYSDLLELALLSTNIKNIENQDSLRVNGSNNVSFIALVETENKIELSSDFKSLPITQMDASLDKMILNCTDDVKSHYVLEVEKFDIACFKLLKYTVGVYELNNTKHKYILHIYLHNADLNTDLRTGK